MASLQLSPSKLFGKIHEKLLSEFLGNSLNALPATEDEEGVNANRQKVLNILKHSLRFIRISSMKQLNLELLSRIDVIPRPILRILSEHKNQDLMSMFPINIKRQIWMFKQVLFDKEFERVLLTEYAESICNDDGSSYFSKILRFDAVNDDLYIELNKIKRANNDSLKEMVDDIGSSSVLMNRCFENIEKCYLNALSQPNKKEKQWLDLVSFCNFRIDIACSLYDHAHRHLVNENDRIWALIHSLYYPESGHIQKSGGKNVLSATQIEALHKALSDKYRVVESSMLLSIPYIKAVLLNSYVFIIEGIATKQMLPRDSKSLSVLTSILQIAADPFSWYKAHKSGIKQKGGVIPKVDHVVLFQFNPLLTASIYCDSLELDPEDFVLNTADIIKYCKDSPLCTLILIHYVLYLLHKKRTLRMLQIMDMAIKHRLEGSHLLAINGLTEIHLLCSALKQSNLKATSKSKCIEFLVVLVGQTKYDEQVRQTIVDAMHGIGLFAGDIKRFQKRLRE